MFITGSSVAARATGRLLFGHDSFGNVCGRKNSPVEGAPLSGQDMTLKKHVFFMDPCHLDVRVGRLASTALCVASCPEEQLRTLEEVQLFANNTALSLAMMLTFRVVTRLLVHTLVALVIVGLLFVCGVLWWLYYDYSADLSMALDTERDNVTCLLGFAVVATVLTAVLLVLIFILRTRAKLAVELLQVTNKALSRCPFLLLQPLWTCAVLLLFWALWGAVLLGLGTAGAAQVTAGGRVEYQPLSGLRYLWGYHLLGLLWTSDFILACQQMAVAGAVAACYFNSGRATEGASSQGLCAAASRGRSGSASTVPPPPPVLFWPAAMAGTESRDAHVRGSEKEAPHALLDGNAYVATAINGTEFCTSAKDALRLLSENSSRFTSVSCFGDFVVFLGKVLVACLTAFGGLMAFNYHRTLQVWAVPLLLAAALAYLVAHSFLSVFETVLGALLLCLAADLHTNDGSPGKPYFMDHELLSFVKRMNRTHRKGPQGAGGSTRNREGTELQPVVRSTC
ncbi:Choline transporter-like protein 3 [Myotis davidii]|uniref:Choline transporter-like protein n=1 Tax=Myotis davidii TaxID=225400 RepID=L5LXE6_MYODS|nr:Choline transporter-like protein 3 [Myotis davidii]